MKKYSRISSAKNVVGGVDSLRWALSHKAVLITFYYLANRPRLNIFLSFLFFFLSLTIPASVVSLETTTPR